MKPAPFSYHRPASLDETWALLEREPDARVLAGGQSLVPALNMRLATPAALVDINRLPGLDAIRVGPAGLAIGALCRQETARGSPLVAREAPLLAQALPHVGHLAIRTRGTVGGSVALADPAAELPACLVALDAVVRVASRRGTREVAAGDFFRGVYTTALEPGELVVEVVIPPRRPGARDAFLELSRRHGDYALVGLAVHADLTAGAVDDLRIVCCGVGSTPVRARGAEAALRGRRPDAAAVQAAQEALGGELDPPADVHASAALRRHLARVLLARALAALGAAERQGRGAP
jgi:carbon-monoxide dehydrogenase medium subunit